jgi:chromate transporter
VIKNFLKIEAVQGALKGVRPCVVALILGTAITLAFSTLLGLKTIGETPISPDYIGIVIFAFVFALAEIIKKVKGKKPSPIIVILISAALGMILYSLA